MFPDQDNIARKLDVTTAAMQTKGTVNLSVSQSLTPITVSLVLIKAWDMTKDKS